MSCITLEFFEISYLELPYINFSFENIFNYKSINDATVIHSLFPSNSIHGVVATEVQRM